MSQIESLIHCVQSPVSPVCVSWSVSMIASHVAASVSIRATVSPRSNHWQWHHYHHYQQHHLIIRASEIIIIPHSPQLFSDHQTVKMTKLDSQNKKQPTLGGIWNPWIDVVQNEALDLTKKTEEDKDQPDISPTFFHDQQVFFPFYFNASFNQVNSFKHPVNHNSSRRDFLNNYKTRSETVIKTSKKTEKKSRAKAMKKIESIKESCDCRFCYEDHIMKMRMKSSKQKPY